ncbi:MAG: hypothetical protein AAFX79_13460 [Planctomycetota bacterium]
MTNSDLDVHSGDASSHPTDEHGTFGRILDVLEQAATDPHDEILASVRRAVGEPLPPDEAVRLLRVVVERLQRSISDESISAEASALVGDARQLAEQIEAEASARKADAPSPLRLWLEDASYVEPRPWFHGQEIRMKQGYVDTRDIQLWPHNERLEIHLAQFRQRTGREPSAEELIDIMLSRMDLPGAPDGDDRDQFKIVQLARSIAINGVRKPPILASDGRLLDGNRRVTACQYILHNPEFGAHEKRRAARIFVWQMTEDATDDECDKVVVSLNFEPDCKEDWPEYVKARKVHEEWRSRLALEPREPGPKEQTRIRKDISKQFALGPDASHVNRYIKMVEMADEFEEYQQLDRRKDEYETKHRSSEYFQYFDELQKGKNAGGVAWSLGQDDAFKHTVFDLLYDGKFKNFAQIRDLKHIYANQEARDVLRKAREESDPDEAQERIAEAIAIARTAKAEARELGANTRIETFVKWLEELPLRTFRDTVTDRNRTRLHESLSLVSHYIGAIETEESS